MASIVGIQRPDRASLISVLLTALAITVNHLFTLGSSALFLGAALVALASGLWVMSRRTTGQAARTGYLLVNAWIVIGFGLFKGLWDIVLPIFAGTWLASTSPTYARPVFGPFWFEMSGVMMFIGSLFVLYYGILTLGSRRRAVLAAGASALTFAAGLAGYAATERDVWTPPMQSVVKIGVIVPTDGPYSMLGNFIRQGRSDGEGRSQRHQVSLRAGCQRQRS